MRVPLVTAAVRKRVIASNYEQPRRGQCLICGKDWMECSHSRADIDIVVNAVKFAKALGI